MTEKRVSNEDSALVTFTSSPGGAGIVAIDCLTPTPEICTFDLTSPPALDPNNFAVVVDTSTFSLRERGTNQISDQLLFLAFDVGSTGAPVLHFSFISDTNVLGGLGPCTNDCVDETGALQLAATAIFYNGQGVPLDTVTIRIQSDVQAAVPEPATLGLLSLGLAGLGFSRRRKSN